MPDKPVYVVGQDGILRGGWQPPPAPIAHRRADCQSAPQAAAPAFLKDEGLRLLLFGGKGGVGKTTCAAAAALRLAARRPRERFLLVSADPAHSLQDSLAGTAPPPNLKVLELDAQQCLEAFRAAHGQKLQEIATAGTFLDDEDVRQFLSLSLPGLDELMAFLEISDWVESGQYACVVVDTAPSGHTLRLLEMPAQLRKWLAMLDALLAKRRYLRRVFGRSVEPDHLDLFVREWSATLGRMSALFSDGVRCQFVPVTLAEPLSVRETAALLKKLHQGHIPVTDLVVNQLHPPGACVTCAAAHAQEQEQMGRLWSPAGQPALWAIGLFGEEVRGAGPLDRFWDNARLVEKVSDPVPGPAAAPCCPVAEPAVLPTLEHQVILFAGKGGVGKTTLACATAVRLAHDFPEKRILLFSTDPAHSLSACLEIPVGPQPVRVLGRLSAMEIDAHAEFRVLQAGYADDVERFLHAVSSHFDLTFDRVVLEKLMDLAPPGLDEVMALTRMLDLLSHRRYDLFVLDSAATGHFIRLMELPALIDAWLKTFFNVLLKYEGVIELPRFADQLVELSKNLKQFRKLARDAARTVLYAVSIPTQMALEETRDLLSACERLEIPVPAIFLNLLTPSAGCALCQALRKRERCAVDSFQQAFPGKAQVLVYRQEHPAGLERLAQLAKGLYHQSQELTEVYATE
jgi:arsenite/tail-anchored protein-transporting ATPase